MIVTGNPVLTIDQHVDALAANLPSGRVWTPKFKNESVLRRFLRGLAPTFLSLDAAVQRYVQQVVPVDTEDFLAEWETALGIPDGCIPLELTPDRRRRNIRIKLAVLAGVTTRTDFENLAALFGLVISVGGGIEHVAIADGGYGTRTPVLDIPTDIANVNAARMTLVVTESRSSSITFPWEFSAAGPVVPVGLKFSLDDQNTLRCLIKKLVPANVDVKFVEGS